MKGDYIRARVTEEIKQKVVMIAKSQGMDESEYLRFLIANAILEYEKGSKK